MQISNSIIYPLVSMGRITGRQSAPETLEDLWNIFLPRIPKGEHSVDCCVLTSMGLYANTEGSERQKHRLNLARFERDFSQGIRVAQILDERVNPHALNTIDWDALIHQSNALYEVAQSFGKLSHLASASKSYKAALESLCHQCGRKGTKEDISFFHEEFAVLYLIATRTISLRRRNTSLRQDDKGPVYLSYPGPIPYAEALAFSYLHGRRKFPRNSVIYANTENDDKPVFTDLADIIGQVDLSGRQSAFL